MKRPCLTVEKRTVLGKKIKKLRKSGILPANIYGKDVESLAVQVAYKDFESIFKKVGETGLLDIAVDGQTRPVLIHNVQYDYINRLPLHADFFQVNLKEKVKTMVPIAIVGEPIAVTEKVGLLLQPLSEVEVEALPEDLPEHIEVNVEHLTAIDQQITVGELKIPSGVTVLTNVEQVVVKISELVSKEAAQQAEQEKAAKEAAKEEAEAQTTEEVPKETPAKEEQVTPQEEKKEEKK